MIKITKRQFLKQLGGLAALSLTACNVPPSKAKRPNILFAISDDQSWRHTGFAGCPFIKTPALDRIASEGIVFKQAFAAAPQCSPCRAAILTGRYIWQLEEAGTHASLFPKKYRVFTDLLHDSGYQVGYTGKPWGPGNWKISGWQHNPVGPEYNQLTMDAPQNIRKTDYTANFKTFFEQRDPEKPFFFWYGASEPHRPYMKGIGIKQGKDPGPVAVPSFLPDVPEVRSDLLDYAVEIEWFDSHLGRMIKLLEEAGELDNTLIIATSDNGMPFPRAKANLYEYGIHMPLTMRWPQMIKPGRQVDDLVSFVDFAPTFLNAAGLPVDPQMSGKSMIPLLESRRSGKNDATRKYVMAGRERHTHARPDNLGYPSRVIRTDQYLFIRNFKPDRRPAGDPTGSGEPQGYHDIDACPTFDYMLSHQQEIPGLFARSVAKRPEYELYDIIKDPECLNNLAEQSEYDHIKNEILTELMDALTRQGDPRALGTGDIFESYPRFSRMRKFEGFKKQGEYNPKYQ